MPARLRRLLPALLLLTQTALPLASAFADEPPTPVTHVAHVSGEPQTGCHVHDAADCLHCRVLSALGLAAPAATGTLEGGGATVAIVPPAPALRGGRSQSIHQPRAPPAL